MKNKMLKPETIRYRLLKISDRYSSLYNQYICDVNQLRTKLKDLQKRCSHVNITRVDDIKEVCEDCNVAIQRGKDFYYQDF